MNYALCGNQNCGKTTLFNALTGSTAHVGNWPGVTVEKKEGLYKKGASPANIVDLPGIYSLSPYSPEEVVTRDYIINSKPDLVINIVDSTNLERNLYLTTQILETDRPVVVALNMSDMAKKSGIIIDKNRLSQLLGVPVVEISALREEGIGELMALAEAEAGKPRKPESVLEASYLQGQLKEIRAALDKDRVENSLYHSVKLLEGDSIERETYSGYRENVARARRPEELPQNMDRDYEGAIAAVRYDYITTKLKQAFEKDTSSLKETTTDKLDKWLTGKFTGIPIFLLLMLFVFNTVFGENWLYVTGVHSPGVFLFNITETFLGWFAQGVAWLLEIFRASHWITGLINDGLVAGVTSVLVFSPQILFLFFFLSLMEDTGYMSRAAFIMDRILKKFGLSGKAFMPLLMGFGCSVPAILATRSLNSEKERRMTIMLMPFFSCGAKFPIWAMFSAAVFGAYADIAIFGIYFIGILTAATAAVILNQFVFQAKSSPFIMELPPYRLPGPKSLSLHLWEKLKGFVLRATTIIASSTVIIWFLGNFSFRLHMVEANSGESIIGLIGNFLRPLFTPLGFAFGDDGWKAVVAILTGLIAKEMVVSTLGVLYTDVGGDALEDVNASNALKGALGAAFTPLSAISYMVFNLLCVPCMAAVAAAHGEMGKFKSTLLTIGFWLITAWCVSFLLYYGGSLMGF